MDRLSPVEAMLQYAFGPRHAGGTPTSQAATHAGGATASGEMAPHLLALATAARAWWESGRPAGWSLQQHLADPAVGCDGSQAQRALAAAVAQWVTSCSP